MLMNEKLRDSDGDVIDFTVLFHTLRKYVVLLIVAAVVCGVGAYFYTEYFIPEQYKASATVIVNNRASDSQYIYPSEISSSQDLAELYSIIIKSDTVLEQVIDDLDLNLSYEQLRNSVTVQTVSSTQVVEISMVGTDPEYIKSIVAKFVEYSKPMILEKVEAGSVKDLNEAAVSNNGNPISPNKSKNAMMGGIAGFVIVAAIVLLKELLNTKIKSENDVTNTLNVPLLGVIPAVDRKEFNK